MNNMDLSNSDLSGIPADLLAAHEFQKGSEIHSQPIQVPAQPVQAEIKIKDEDMSELMEDVKDESTYKQEQSSNSATAKIEAEANGGENKTPEQMDTLDKALAADKVVKEEGYESSDLELSSDDDEEEESDSSSSSDDDDDEDDEEVEEEGKENVKEGKGKKGNNNKKMAADYDDEDDIAPDGIVKTAHEIVDIVIEKPEFEFTPDTEIILAGEIYQIIDNVVVVHCRPGSEHMTLDQGSLLVYKDRVILGEVFETFGPVPRPYYSVRFNNPSEINKDLCKVGEPVYFVPSYEKTRIVKTEELKKIKGYDASNMYDEEIGEEEMEFSDDEKELQFKRKKNKEKKANSRRNGDSSNNSNNPNSNPNHHHNQSRFAPQKRNRALPDDFDSALAAYESSQGPLPPRQQQSYADLNDGYAFQQGFPLPSANRSALPPPPANPYRTPAELVTELFGSSSQNPVNQYNRPQPSLPQQQPQYQPQPQQQYQQHQQHQQYQQQPPQLNQNQNQNQSQNQNQNQNQGQNQQSKKSFRSIFAEPPPPSS